MSHFSVLVRVPSKVPEVGIEHYINKIMLPYKESGCGSDDPPELKQYLVFKDIEDEYRVKYENETSSMVKLDDGTIISAYDTSFRNPLYDITQSLGQYKYPATAELIEVPHKERFPTFEKFMEEYVGLERDKDNGRYGYWHNPNQKWDWWCIGGRWTGHLKLGYSPARDPDNYEQCWICKGTGSRKDFNYSGEQYDYLRKATPAGHPVIGHGCNSCCGTGYEFKFSTKLKPVGNYIKINLLDWELIEKETILRLDKFWKDWTDLCEGKKFDSFDGPRSRALDLGLLECKDVSELTGTEWKVSYWDSPDTPVEQRRNRCDVLKNLTKEYVVENFKEVFSPIMTWALLDKTNGWQEKGKMGWFATSNATPESIKEHTKKLSNWIKDGDPNDWLVVVDCHI